MNIGGKLFAFGTVLYFGLGAVYWFMSGDVIGTSLLALTGGLAFLIAFYVLFTSKRVGVLPEDIETALISDADTDYGFFSPHSWWPFAIGASTFIFVLGFNDGDLWIGFRVLPRPVRKVIKRKFVCDWQPEARNSL
jgi:hypothetical protein